MNRQIQEIKKRVKFGLLSKEQAQIHICKECMQYPDRECIRPCPKKKEQQKQRYYTVNNIVEHRKIMMLDNNNKYYRNIIEYEPILTFKTFNPRYHSEKVINPDNIEIIQKANLEQNFKMATIYIDIHNERKKWIIQKPRLALTVGDAHLWSGWRWYQMGSPQNKRYEHGINAS